jgi:hypothetical protein
MFIFTKHQPIGKLLNSEYEINPANHSGTMKAYIHTYIHTKRQTDGLPKTTFFFSVGLLMCKYTKISRSIFFTITIFSHIYIEYIYEKVKLILYRKLMFIPILNTSLNVHLKLKKSSHMCLILQQTVGLNAN